MEIKLPKFKGLPGGRKFWFALIGAGVAFCNAYFEWELSAEQIFTVLSPLFAFIFMEGSADIVSRLK